MSRLNGVIDQKILYAVIVGVILFACLIGASMFVDLEEYWWWIGFFIMFFVVGSVATGALRGLILSFVLGLVFVVALIAVTSPSELSGMTLNDASYVLLISGISAILGAVGGFLSERYLQ